MDEAMMTRIEALILILFTLFHKDVLCAISEQGARARSKATARAGVTFSIPPQEGYADGTVIWAETLDVTLQEVGRAKKNVQLKKNRQKYLGSLKQHARKEETFAAYSSSDYEIVCRVLSNKQNGPQATRCAGVAMVGGEECMLVGSRLFCTPPDVNVTGHLDDILPIPIVDRKKRSAVTDLSALHKEQARLHSRRRRSVQNLTVEACVTADVSIYNFFAVNIDLPDGATPQLDAEQYIAAVINEVDNFFSKVVNTSLTIDVVLRGVNVSQSDSDNTWTSTGNIVDFNTAFPRLAADASTHFKNKSNCDIIIGLTAKDISNNTQVGSNMLGVAYYTGCCYPNYNLALVEHKFRVSYVMAHEIAHLLGGNHDPASNASCFTPSKIMNESMSFVLDADRQWYNFSTCSATDFKHYIDNKWWSSCLHHNTYNASQLQEDRCAGFSGHLLDTPVNKCRMLYGTAELCVTDHTVEDICNGAIQCRLNATHCSYQLSNDGFLCQDDTDKRCHEGRCKPPVQIPCTTTK